jgi:hypothetical protein
MQARHLASWMLEQEARALLTRLDRVKPFALQETMLPAAALSPAAQTGIEQYLMRGRRELRGRIHRYIRWLRGPGAAMPPEVLQQRFTFLRLQFNLALSQLDLFSDAITQRSESETGVWLSGLDIAAQDALSLPGGYYDAPPIVCYLHRGLGGAIRRARTRLPGGGDNPVAIIRIPRERMIGYGIASSLVHEVGHQAAALLGLVESLRPVLQRRQRASRGPAALGWQLWERWISEIVADFWSLARVGVSSTLGLIGVVSLPRAFVFRLNADDPHPFAWIRVNLSCAFGDALYPNPQWRQLATVWESFYPARGLRPELMDALAALQSTMPEFVRTVIGHRPASLRGQALGDAVRMPGRTPGRLLAHYRRWAANPEGLRAAPPTLAFAVLGQARAAGLLTPEKENRLLGNLITYWALRSTLDVNASMARLPLTAGVAAPPGAAGPPWRAGTAVPAGPQWRAGAVPASPLAIRRVAGRAGLPGGPYRPRTQAARAGPPGGPYLPRAPDPRAGGPAGPHPGPAQAAPAVPAVAPRRSPAPARPARPRALGTSARASA